jgi:hypothetical protein
MYWNLQLVQLERTESRLVLEQALELELNESKIDDR